MDTPKTKARLYLEDDFQESRLCTLSQQHSHYLIHVLRVKLSDALRVFNGRQGEWLGHIHFITKKEVTLKLITPLRPQFTPKPMGLIFAPIRHNRLDMMIEKATELGATAFYPVHTTYTQIPKINTERLQHLVLEAAEQSEQLSVARIHPLMPLPKFLINHADLVVGYCDETGSGKPLRAYQDEHIDAFLIGPEGGFSPEEHALIRAHKNTRPISLGPTILRAETAALAALAGWIACTLE